MMIVLKSFRQNSVEMKVEGITVAAEMPVLLSFKPGCDHPFGGTVAEIGPTGYIHKVYVPQGGRLEINWARF